MGPLKDKGIADFVKAINDGKIIFRVSTTTFPLGEIVGNITAGGGAGGNMTAGGNIMNKTGEVGQKIAGGAANLLGNASEKIKEGIGAK